MKACNFFTLLLLLLGIALNSHAQKTEELSLNEAIQLAKKQSELAKGIQADFESYMWNYNAIKAGLLPQISMNGRLPNYFRTINPITQPDGTVKLIAQSQLNSRVGIDLEQTIMATGGSVFLSSGLAQYNILGGEKYKYWQSSPLTIGFTQPLTLFNSVKWNYEQAKLQADEATRRQIEDFEDLSLNITRAYFDLYVAKMQLKNASQNVINNDTLYKISTGRFNLGRIAENELLQVELQLMNARNSLAQNQLSVSVNNGRLKNLLGINDDSLQFDLIPVTDVPFFEVDPAQAVAEARKNRSDIIGFQLSENEARMQLKRAQSGKFANGSVSASFGLNQSAGNLRQAYMDPLSSQNVSVDVSIPLVGWGKYKSNINSSRYHLESTLENLKYQQRDFDIQVETAVNQFKQLQGQLLIAAKSDTIAQKRYSVAKNRYLLGKISITDLGLAQDDKDKALIEYIQTLEKYWIAYYQLRRSTLYDFETGREIRY
ncbi:TolC family protein [Compostibacter hankyongensis]|uniref:TolC family protein n=1 Tax=Compostibacter hankyongensis TaxID=1007089 RepID=A0ABP8FHF3_9BACT